MMLRACVNARASSDDEVRFCLRLMPSSAAGWETWDLRSPDGRRTCLYVLVVRYTYDSSVQALDSRTARRTTRAVKAPAKSHNSRLVVNLLSKGLWVGRTLLVRNAATQKKAGFH